VVRGWGEKEAGVKDGCEGARMWSRKGKWDPSTLHGERRPLRERDFFAQEALREVFLD
jgi:hypothetical protein